jgi:S-DNA-T family DNA segregation ATPase FtsK/SpoIIIE
MAGNRLKQQERSKPAKQPAESFKKDKEPDVKMKALVKDERTHKVLGTFFLLLAAFLFIAFTSYLFTWKDDQGKFYGRSFSVLFDDKLQAENLLGRLGAYISHLFFFKGTGIASYFCCYFFFIIGVNLIVGRKVFRIGRNIRYILLGLLYTSTLLGFIFHVVMPSSFSAGGALGNMTSEYLVRFMGITGTILLLGVAGLAFPDMEVQF